MEHSAGIEIAEELDEETRTAAEILMGRWAVSRSGEQIQEVGRLRDRDRRTCKMEGADISTESWPTTPEEALNARGNDRFPREEKGMNRGRPGRPDAPLSQACKGPK